jgi:hypothetical protein
MSKTVAMSNTCKHHFVHPCIQELGVYKSPLVLLYSFDTTVGVELPKMSMEWHMGAAAPWKWNYEIRTW